MSCFPPAHFMSRMKLWGFSRYCLIWLLKRAIVAPSSTRWSPDQLMLHTVALYTSPAALKRGKVWKRPRAPIATCAQKSRYAATAAASQDSANTESISGAHAK